MKLRISPAHNTSKAMGAVLTIGSDYERLMVCLKVAPGGCLFTRIHLLYLVRIGWLGHPLAWGG